MLISHKNVLPAYIQVMICSKTRAKNKFSWKKEIKLTRFEYASRSLVILIFYFVKMKTSNADDVCDGHFASMILALKEYLTKCANKNIVQCKHKIFIQHTLCELMNVVEMQYQQRIYASKMQWTDGNCSMEIQFSLL